MRTHRSVRLVVAPLAFAAIAPAAIAQTGTVAGTVRNAVTREPIEGALVRIGGTSYGSFSRANGTFTIIGVPPGAYTVAAHRLGFATARLTKVDVQIGRTRTLAFALRPSQGDSTESVEFEPALNDPNIARNAMSLANDELIAMPTLNISGAIGLGGAYLDLATTSATISQVDLHRGIRSVPTIRGARPEATLYLLDGIDVSNPVFGSPPMFIEPFAAAGVTVSPSHADAEDGAAVAGVVSQSIRAGGRHVNGTFEVQTTAVPGKFGAAASAASGITNARGFVSGPAPFIGDKLQFMFAGHVANERVSVTRKAGAPWKGFGDSEDAQLVGKLTWAVRPSVNVSLSGVRQRRAAVEQGQCTFKPDDPDCWQTLGPDSVAIPTVRDESRFLTARIEKRLARASIALSAARHTGNRETCSIWQGVCIGDRMDRHPVGDEIPIFMPPHLSPYAQTGTYFGGEQYRTNVLRADVIAQASEHNSVRAGIYSATHDITYSDAQMFRWLQGSILLGKDIYRARPVEFSSYAQDAMEYDLLTVHFGLRFDWANTGGYAIANPANPTNGTTAREVCDGQLPGVSERPFTYAQYSGIVACLNSPIGESGRPILLDSATLLAQRDDFIRVRPRAAFAPRIALSFPLSEVSGMFLDVGRYARNPLYHNAFRNSGTGTRAGNGRGTDDYCAANRTQIGTDECVPNYGADGRIPDFVGNPGLSFEMSDGFEAGFTTQLDRAHSLDASVFSNTQSHLPKLYLNPVEMDLGRTYGVLRTASRGVSSSASSTALGMSVTVRQRRIHALAYTVNYTWQKGHEIDAAPDLVAEFLAAGGTTSCDGVERVTTRGHQHALNGLLSLQWTDRTPKPLGRAGRMLFGYSRTVLTVSAASAAGAPSRNADNHANCAAPFVRIIPGTGTLADLLYMRTLNQHGAQWALILRVRNLLNVDDGSRLFLQQTSGRRILAGTSVTF